MGVLMIYMDWTKNGTLIILEYLFYDTNTTISGIKNSQYT